MNAIATYEMVPGQGIGHLADVIDSPYSVRKAYSSSPSWTDPSGRDTVSKALGLPTAPTTTSTGAFTSSSGVLEMNPAWAAQPRITLEGPRGSRQPSVADLEKLRSGEAFRAYMGAQNMGTFHIVVPDAPRSERTSMRVSLPGSVSQEQMAELNNLARPHRLFVSDTGNGITFINPADDPKAAELMEMTLRSEWGRTVSDVLGVGRRDLKTVKVVPGNIDYEPEFAQANAGLGKATQKLFENTTPEARAALDADPAVREQVGAHAERDAEWAAAGSGPARADIQLARRIYVERGFAGLLEALEKGLPLPVIFTALGLGKADDAPSSGKGP